MTPEGRVKKEIKRRLDLLPRTWWYMPVPGGFGKPVLDFLICCNGRFFAIEAKAKKKKLTPRQDATVEEMRAAGVLVFIIDDPEIVERAIYQLRAIAGV